MTIEFKIHIDESTATVVSADSVKGTTSQLLGAKYDPVAAAKAAAEPEPPTGGDGNPHGPGGGGGPDGQPLSGGQNRTGGDNPHGRGGGVSAGAGTVLVIGPIVICGPDHGR